MNVFAANRMNAFDIAARTLDGLTCILVADPANAELPTTPVGLYALVDGLTRMANPLNLDAVLTIASRLPAPEWKVMLLMGIERARPGMLIHA